MTNRPPVDQTAARPVGALLWIVVAAGLFFRFWQYLHSGSLWLDEAWLANNVVPRSLGALLTQPLDFNQGAPLGFLLLVKLATFVLGSGELALRFVPLLFGVGSVLLALRLAVKLFESLAARACLVGLVSFSPALIYYSSEFKQYSTDLFVCMAILAVAFRPERVKHGFLLLAGLGAALIWFSHPAALVLAAVGVTFLWEWAARREGNRLAAWCATGMVWLASFAVAYGVSLRELARNPRLTAFWLDGFAPLLPGSMQQLGWYWKSALGFTYLAFFAWIPADVPAAPEWFGWPNILLLALVATGLCCMFHLSRRLFGHVALTIAIAVGVSGLQLYPFRGRMILFLTVAAYLAVSSLVAWLDSPGRKEGWRAASRILAVTMLAIVLVAALQHVHQPHPHSVIARALVHVRDHRSPGDALVLESWNGPALDYYRERLALSSVEVSAWLPDRSVDPERFRRYCCAGSDLSRVWIVITRLDLHLSLVDRLRSMQQPLDSWESHGEGAYLFDFAATELCGGLVKASGGMNVEQGAAQPGNRNARIAASRPSG